MPRAAVPRLQIFRFLTVIVAAPKIVFSPGPVSEQETKLHRETIALVDAARRRAVPD